MSIFKMIFQKEEFDNVTGLNKELKALYVYNKFINNNRSIVFVTSSLYEANVFYKTLLNYTNDVLFFPMDDFLTSEALAISPELKNNRLETLNELIKNNKKISPAYRAFGQYFRHFLTRASARCRVRQTVLLFTPRSRAMVHMFFC